MTTAILFLEFDGVINGSAWLAERFAAHGPCKSDADMIDPSAVERVNRILDATGARVVVSSTWRINRSLTALREVLGGRGFRGTIVGKTPVLHQQRGTEIGLWLSRNPMVKRWAILDDSDDMDGVRDRLVRTSTGAGIQDEHVERVIALLGALPARPVAPVCGVDDPNNQDDPEDEVRA